jgi:hypothetical protein
MRWCGQSNRYFAESAQVRAETHSDDLSFGVNGPCSVNFEDPVDFVRRRPVCEQLIESLPITRRKRGRCASEDCAICLRSGINKKVDPRMRFISLPCKHSFHYYCVASWVTKMSGSCPICRTPVDTSLAVAAAAASIAHVQAR